VNCIGNVAHLPIVPSLVVGSSVLIRIDRLVFSASVDLRPRY
jgi:hypothetical protein